MILLRSLHVPTRYVSGYFAHESDGKGWTLVRQRDAHAWAESWVDGAGWVTVDATPGNGRPDQLAGPIPLWWRALGRRCRICWARSGTGSSRQAGRKRPRSSSLLVLGLLIPQVYRWWQRRRLAAQGFQYSRPDAALAALAARFEALLTRRGLPCPEGRTWREHLRVVEEKEDLRLPPLEAVRAGIRAGPLRPTAGAEKRSRALTPSCANWKKEESMIATFAETIEKIEANLASVIRGKPGSIRLLLISLLAGGHTLLEDVPGTGKTTLAKSLARSMDGIFRRIQFTPDLLPADITGSSFYNPGDGSFTFREGPVFANVVLADEINRTSPRTQSALLEVMSEGQVTVDGKRRDLPHPFFVVATQNPTDFHGTYPLPEAQLDRFAVRVTLGYPDLPHRDWRFCTARTSITRLTA